MVRPLTFAVLLLFSCARDVPRVDVDADADADADTDTDTDVDTDADADVQDPRFGQVTIGVHPEVETVLTVTWETKADTEESWLEWTLDGESFSSPRRQGAVGSSKESVLGLPGETAVDVVLHAIMDGKPTSLALPTVSTGALPERLAVPSLVSSDPTRIRPERYLLASVDSGNFQWFGPSFTVILDERGRVVWYRETSGHRLTFQPMVSDIGGYVLIDATTYYVGGVPTITKTTLDLDQLDEITVPHMGLTFHELDDGSVLFDESVDPYTFHLTRQFPDGSQTRIWSCGPFMDLYSTAFWACAPNAVRWDRDRNSVLYSMFETSTVVEIDLTTGSILREMGEYPGGHAFAPPSSAFELQHAPSWTQDGTLIVSTHVPGQPGVQMAREFRVDDAGNALVEVWSLQAPRYAEYAGQVQKLASGNVLWQLGTGGLVVEMTPEGDVVWELSWSGHLTGNVTPVADLYELNSGW